MKATELLKINYSKYASISIKGVLFRGLTIVSKESGGSISILGFKGEEVIMSTGFLKEEQVKIEERSGTLYIDKERR